MKKFIIVFWLLAIASSSYLFISVTTPQMIIFAVSVLAWLYLGGRRGIYGKEVVWRIEDLEENKKYKVEKTVFIPFAVDNYYFPARDFVAKVHEITKRGKITSFLIRVPDLELKEGKEEIVFQIKKGLLEDEIVIVE